MDVSSIFPSSEVRRLLKRSRFFITATFANVPNVVNLSSLFALTEDICFVEEVNLILLTKPFFEGLFVVGLRQIFRN